MSYGFFTTVDAPFEEVLTKVTESLKSEGFGVLTAIDVQETMKKKLGVDFRKYHILGACNPPFAHQALQLEEEIGLLLPCNVIVYEKGDKIAVGAFNPMAITKLSDDARMMPIAEEVKVRLVRALAKLSVQ